MKLFKSKVKKRFAYLRKLGKSKEILNQIEIPEESEFKFIEKTKNFEVNEIAKKETNWMKNILNLSIEQTYLVDSVNYLFAFKFESVLKNFNGATKSLKSNIDKLIVEKRKVLKHILDQKQLNIYNSEVAKLRKKSILLI